MRKVKTPSLKSETEVTWSSDLNISVVDYSLLVLVICWTISGETNFVSFSASGQNCTNKTGPSRSLIMFCKTENEEVARIIFLTSKPGFWLREANALHFSRQDDFEERKIWAHPRKLHCLRMLKKTLSFIVCFNMSYPEINHAVSTLYSSQDCVYSVTLHKYLRVKRMEKELIAATKCCRTQPR